MNLRLVGVSGSQLGREISIDELPVEIGRAANARIRIDDRWVSRLHCRLDLADQGLRIRDLGSTHGTLVNGRLIDESPLVPGDRVTIGLSQFRLEADVAAPTCERLNVDDAQCADLQVSACAV